MEALKFWKMSGSGNDFIIIDNRDGRVPDSDMGRLVERACRRRESVGADGLIFVTESEQYDFAWRFFNADGGEVDMCGNGSRCVARFAFSKGIAGDRMTFETLAGPISAEVHDRTVKVLIDARNAVFEEKWSSELEIDFWDAYKKITQAVAPVTVESVKALYPSENIGLSKRFGKTKARRTVNMYTTVAVIVLAGPSGACAGHGEGVRAGSGRGVAQHELIAGRRVRGQIVLDEEGALRGPTSHQHAPDTG